MTQFEQLGQSSTGQRIKAPDRRQRAIVSMIEERDALEARIQILADEKARDEDRLASLNVRLRRMRSFQDVRELAKKVGGLRVVETGEATSIPPSAP